LSWSGERSRAVSDLLDEWLQCVIQAVDPWMSSKDIDRGTLWFSEVSDQLQNTSIGIICLTKDNLEKPWILFEAGALAKGLKNTRVCTFLIDLDANDVGTPLSQFNHTLPNREGLWSLVRTLNNALKEKGLKEKTLEAVFEIYWPQFESRFNQILDDIEPTGTVNKRPDKDILIEILETSRSMDRRVRKLESNSNNDSFNSLGDVNVKSLKEHDFGVRGVDKAAVDMFISGKYSDKEIILHLSSRFSISNQAATNEFMKIVDVFGRTG